MLTGIEKKLRSENDKFSEQLKAYKHMRLRKLKMIDRFDAGELPDKLEYDVKLLDMYISALNDMLTKMNDIEHLIGSGD